jgi:hypothetical protein
VFSENIESISYCNILKASPTATYKVFALVVIRACSVYKEVQWNPWLLLQQLWKGGWKVVGGSIVERKVEAAWGGVCKRQAREKGTNRSTEIHPPVMVNEFHGFSPGTF